MFDKWFPLFKKVTFASELIPLPEDFISFLQEDGVYVSESNWTKRPTEEDRYDAYEEPWPDEDGAIEPKSFPALDTKIRDSIQRLGGTVFPKLNWSAPKDATWMSTTGLLQCHSPSEVILLLKSSELIDYDLSHAYILPCNSDHFKF